MTNKMKCPFCNGELYGCIGHPYCRNEKCEMCDEMLPRELLDLLDRTRKALDLALAWLEKVATPAKCDDDLCREFTKRKIDEIKQLITGNQ